MAHQLLRCITPYCRVVYFASRTGVCSRCGNPGVIAVRVRPPWRRRNGGPGPPPGPMAS